MFQCGIETSRVTQFLWLFHCLFSQVHRAEVSPFPLVAFGDVGLDRSKSKCFSMWELWMARNITEPKVVRRALK